jgi:mevalonate kinase
VDLNAELNTLPSDHPIASVIHNFLFLSHVSPFPNLEIKITSTIPVASGLGSGAAVTVALIRALCSHFNYSMPDEEISSFAYEIEKLYHGTPSGIDNTVVTYSKPVYFIKSSLSPFRRGAGGEVDTFKVGNPFTIVIGDTGTRAPTKESVGDVRKLWETDKAKWEQIFDEVGTIVNKARGAIESGAWNQMGKLMNQNHALLQEMTVSSPALDRLVSAACEAGALGAKMSGGGRGGNMIALVTPELAETVSKSLLESGARNTIITQVT